MRRMTRRLTCSMLGGGTDRLLGLPAGAGNLGHLRGEVALLLGHRRHKVTSTARLEDLSNLLALLWTKTDPMSNTIFEHHLRKTILIVCKLV